MFVDVGDAQGVYQALNSSVTNVPPRVGIIVEPALLAGALSLVIEQAGVDDVVPTVNLRSAHLDAVVVTHGVEEAVSADVVIELPDAEGGVGFGRVRTRDGVTDVPIGGVASILELLDRYCPAAVRRGNSER